MCVHVAKLEMNRIEIRRLLTVECTALLGKTSGWKWKFRKIILVILM